MLKLTGGIAIQRLRIKPKASLITPIKDTVDNAI